MASLNQLKKEDLVGLLDKVVAKEQRQEGGGGGRAAAGQGLRPEHEAPELSTVEQLDTLRRLTMENLKEVRPPQGLGLRLGLGRRSQGHGFGPRGGGAAGAAAV